MSYTVDLGPVFEPWKDFGTILKGELKRTVISFNLMLQLTLGPTLAGADYNELMKRHREKIKKIDGEVNAALDKLPAGVGGNTIMWAIAPGPMLFGTVRDVAGKVTPETVDNFMDEYGFKDLSILRIPVGRMATGLAKKGASVGGFVTLNQNAFNKTEEEEEEASRVKWYTPIERILLLQNPLGPKFRRESLENRGPLLLENKMSDDEVALGALMKLNGFEAKYNSEVGVPYVRSKEEMITGLVDIFEKEIEETANISGAATFEEFLEAVKSTTLEKFKPLNAQNIQKDMEAEVIGLIEDKENLEKFLKVTDKELSDFENKEDELKKFLTQKIYEKEFSQARMKSIESIADGVEELKVEILGDIEEKDLEDLKINALGEQLYDVIKSALDRLDKAQQSIVKAQQQAQK